MALALSPIVPSMVRVQSSLPLTRLLVPSTMIP